MKLYKPQYPLHYLRLRRCRSILMAFLFAFLLLALWLVPSVAPAVTFRSSKDSQTLQPQNLQPQNLQQLATSRSNRKIFSQLLFSDNAFFNTSTNEVGSLEYVPYNQYQRQPYVANGYLGARIPAVGHGFAYDSPSHDSAPKDDLLNGWPLFNKRYAGAFVAGFFDIQHNTTQTNFPWLLQSGYESVIAAVPQWTSLRLQASINDTWYVLDPADPESRGSISEYAQHLSLATGIVTTSFVWLDSLRVEYSVLAHRKHINLGIVSLSVLSLLPNTVVPIHVEDVLDFDSAQRCRYKDSARDAAADSIYMLYSPNDIDYVYAATYSTLQYDQSASELVDFVRGDHNVSHEVSFLLTPAASSIEVSKLVAVVTSDLDPIKYTSFTAVLDKARSVVEMAINATVPALRQSHINEWHVVVGDALDVEFPDDGLLTLAARASVYHLNANTRADATGLPAALSVVGLSSDSYGGMVFWDTDLWMSLGLLPYSPSHARSIVNYRLHTHEQAQRNLHSDYAPYPDMAGAVYPWMSGRFGNCTSTGPCFDYEYHINTAVAIAAWELYKSGAVDDEFLEQKAFPLINDAATFYSTYVQFNESLGKYTTRNLTDPDEYANHIDNGAYTNSAIAATMKWASAVLQHLGKPVPKVFSEIQDKMYLPVSADDENIVLEYDGMNSSIGIKQADVVMITYPLGNELISDDQAHADMEYSSLKQVDFGPAMTYPIFSIVSSALLKKGCSSESYLSQAVKPFLRGPFAQFSEQNNDDYETNGGTHPAFPFMTAHGGFLQAILQGLVGFRFDFDMKDGKIRRFLTLDPIKVKTLPNGVFFNGLKYLNQTLSLNLTASELVVHHLGPIDGSPPRNITVRLGSRNPQAGFSDISPGNVLTVPLYEAPDAFSEGFSECGKATLTNITESVYGDSTVLANDGDSTTFWQARTANESKILVDLRNPTAFSRVEVNWGDRPPRNLVVAASKDEYLESENVQFEDAFDVLGVVDFGNDLVDRYRVGKNTKTLKEHDVFVDLQSTPVEITEPFAPQDQHLIVLPSRHNTTNITVPKTTSRFVLLKFEGVHDDGDQGAKIYEMNVA